MSEEREKSKQLEWYRDTVKWLVAIDAGAVLLGTQWSFDERLSWCGRVLFTSSAVALLLGSMTGILAMFKFADYSDSKTQPNHPKAQSDQRGSNKLFWPTFFLTFIGLTAFVLVGVQAVLFPPAAEN